MSDDVDQVDDVAPAPRIVEFTDPAPVYIAGLDRGVAEGFTRGVYESTDRRREAVEGAYSRGLRDARDNPEVEGFTSFDVWTVALFAAVIGFIIRGSVDKRRRREIEAPDVKQLFPDE